MLSNGEGVINYIYLSYFYQFTYKTYNIIEESFDF